MKRFNSIFSILLVLIFATSFLSGCNKSSSNGPVALTVGSGDQAATPSDETNYIKRQTSFDFGDPSGDPNSVTLFFGGAINLGGSVATATHSWGNGDFTYPFQREGVKEAIGGADISYANLECVISHNPPNALAGKSHIADKGAATGLSAAGFDIVSLANEHTNDADLFGVTEFDNTIYNLDIAGVRYVGGGYNYDDAYAPIIGNVRGHKVAYIAFGAFEGGSSSKAKKVSTKSVSTPNEKCIKTSTSGIAYADVNNKGELTEDGAAKVKTAIASAKAQGAKFIVVDLHTGKPMTEIPTADQINVMHRIMDLGANMVVNSHTYTVQPTVKYHNGVIAYSLGNLIQETDFTPATELGRALEVTIGFDADGEIESITPIAHEVQIIGNQVTFNN